QRGTSAKGERSKSEISNAPNEFHTTTLDVALTPHRTTGVILAALGFAFIAIMTLTPQPGPPAFAPSLCVLCGEMAVQDIILNVILFVPFGMGMRLAGVRRHRVIAISFCLTVVIELLQMHIIAGRDSSLGDVITNTLGGVLGVAGRLVENVVAADCAAGPPAIV